MQEFNTQAKIKEVLKSLGDFKDEELKHIAGTGLIIDIIGEGPESDKPLNIALRADIDGLEMEEANHDLPYRTQTKYAHMCGHDGHTATLIMAGCILNKYRNKIPKGSKVRLMF